MKQYKIRTHKVTKYSCNNIITIPEEIAIFFKNIWLTPEKIGTTIILKSGCSLIKPTEEEVESYRFEDCRI